MNYTTTMTIKGQITIPRLIRKKLKLTPSLKFTVSVDEEKGEIKVRPLPDFFEVAKSFQVKTKKNVLEARKLMEENYERF